MGVHDLWKVLARSERKTSLDQLSGHVLAVDLSGWVCQATTYSKLGSGGYSQLTKASFV